MPETGGAALHSVGVLLQDFYDIAINNMTRPQVYEQLAKLAAKSANVSKDAVLQQLAFPEGDPHPGSIISKVSRISA